MFRKKPTYDQYLSFCLKYKIKRNQQTYTIQLNFTHIKYCKYTFYSECVRIFRGLTHKQKKKTTSFRSFGAGGRALEYFPVENREKIKNAQHLSVNTYVRAWCYIRIGLNNSAEFVGLTWSALHRGPVNGVHWTADPRYNIDVIKRITIGFYLGDPEIIFCTWVSPKELEVRHC